MNLGMLQNLAYLAAAILFILGIKKLSSPKTARSGNGMAALGMLVAIVATLMTQNMLSLPWIIGGLVIGAGIGSFLATRVEMTSMPQLVGAFNAFGGLASGLVACSEFLGVAGDPTRSHVTSSTVIIGIGTLIGLLTFTGSFIAFAKLQGIIAGRPRALPANEAVNAVLLLAAAGLSIYLGLNPDQTWALGAIAAIALVVGITLVMPIGGADMPVVVSLLNSYSGLAAAATGFVLGNSALIVSGALVGASGLILTAIMCKAMNRSLANVLFARVGSDDGGGGAAADGPQKQARTMTPEDAALLMQTARKVMIIPGYGLAVAQAQHAVRDLTDILEKEGIEVFFAIHPVAGRMPGHMNVLLAEANIDYDKLYEIEQANSEASQTDVSLVLGANDVVNPAARYDKSSPIYGMPIIDCDKTGQVLIVKRSMGSGYAGVQNPLFFNDNSSMVLGDAKKVLAEINEALKENA
ncbi:MAG: NAD(P)(+) transhydrogenase (Re/Si-specific) subunit beta [Acidobacteriota bacterium]